MYASVGDRLKSPFLYVLPTGKLLVVGLRVKWRLSFPRACLYSVCKCRGQLENTISVRIPYGKVVGSRVKTKMVIESFSYMPIQRMLVWETAKNRNFSTGTLCESCWESG